VPAFPLTDPPEEDAGAATADRYRFQYCCAAARLLAAVAAGVECEVICEWHEDFLVISSDGKVEAVSIKHRDDGSAAWTIATLGGPAGNLRRLLDTFQRANGQIDCCFETNRASNAVNLNSTDPAKREAARAELAQRLGASREDLDVFLERLTITRVPDRAYIINTYADLYAAPALDRLGVMALEPFRAVRIAYELIADASTERLSTAAAVTVLTAAPADRRTVIQAEVLKARCVNERDVAEALQEAARGRVPRLPTLDAEAPEETSMSKKLRAGGLGESVVDTAKRRRTGWFAHRAQYRDIPSRQEELNSIQEWVQDQANLAESSALDTGTLPYGRAMHSDLIARLHDAATVPEGTRPEDRHPTLLTGAAYQLTDDCTVWFSPPEEVPGLDA
jgi:hypothetical protein